jgi:cation diffusion facilitator CzcD-associated flavoprotein CzcO
MCEMPDSAPHHESHHDVLIIGAGFSGIGAAIKLAKAGFHDFLILEAGDGVGGAWHWNTYPGVAVDIPSFSYQFSFDTRSDWSRIYAPGAELKTYAEDCVDKHHLRPRLCLNTTVTAARFDEQTDRWRIDTAEGIGYTARHVILATGILTQPKPPAIPGVHDFTGPLMHTARWDHDVDLRGKRVAIIGTGASAVQIVPSIAPQVADLTVFQRTPIWCLPKPDAKLPKWSRLALTHLPGAQRLTRLVSQILVETGFPIPAHLHTVFPATTRLGESMGRRFLRTQVHDPLVRDQLTPHYTLGCKRPTFSNTYLRTFNRPNVHLETHGIEAITEHGLRTVDGTEHRVDVLILSTGFKVFESGNMPPFPVTGSAGQNLDTWWDEHRLHAYHGVSVSGFPNLFSILGPYGYNGSSYFNLIETQTKHILRCLTHARRLHATRVEITAAADTRYFDRMLARRPRQVFYQGGCGTANSYYFDKHGDVPFRPSLTLEMMWDSATFNLADYRFTDDNSATPSARPSDRDEVSRA